MTTTSSASSAAAARAATVAMIDGFVGGGHPVPSVVAIGWAA